MTVQEEFIILEITENALQGVLINSSNYYERCSNMGGYNSISSLTKYSIQKKSSYNFWNNIERPILSLHN
jgi:hypothetical protein